MISLRNLTKYFHRASVNEVAALQGIDMRIERGDFITVIGSNGAGKSTLLNCLAGTYATDDGDIHLREQCITDWPPHRRARFIGRVFQDPLTGTCGKLSIEQNMSLALRRGSRRRLRIGVRPADRDLFRRQLAQLGLGLERRLKDPVNLLSGGQRQALTMLMATLVRPDLLLLDEHTAALDPKTARQILELTERLVTCESLTTLMVTHNMRHAIHYGNRLVMLHQGRLIFDIRGDEKRSLTPQELVERFYALKGEEIASDKLLLG